MKSHRLACGCIQTDTRINAFCSVHYREWLITHEQAADEHRIPGTRAYEKAHAYDSDRGAQLNNYLDLKGR